MLCEYRAIVINDTSGVDDQDDLGHLVDLVHCLAHLRDTVIPGPPENPVIAAPSGNSRVAQDALDYIDAAVARSAGIPHNRHRPFSYPTVELSAH